MIYSQRSFFAALHILSFSSVKFKGFTTSDVSEKSVNLFLSNIDVDRLEVAVKKGIINYSTCKVSEDKYNAYTQKSAFIVLCAALNDIENNLERVEAPSEFWECPQSSLVETKLVSKGVIYGDRELSYMINLGNV